MGAFFQHRQATNSTTRQKAMNIRTSLFTSNVGSDMGMQSPFSYLKPTGHRWHRTSDTALQATTSRLLSAHAEQFLQALDPVLDQVLDTHGRVRLPRQAQPDGHGTQLLVKVKR